jgi:hypothetical protein
MDCDALRDDQWEQIKGFVPDGTKGNRGSRTDNTNFWTRNCGCSVPRALARPARAAWRLSRGASGAAVVIWRVLGVRSVLHFELRAIECREHGCIRGRHKTATSCLRGQSS